MTLPPGRARLATKPAPTGSPAFVITMGMVVVAFFAANAAGHPCDHDQIDLKTNQVRRKLRQALSFCSANRYSMAIFFPSIHPSLLSSCRNASKRTALPEAVLESRKPMRKIFPVCCASAKGVVISKDSEPVSQTKMLSDHSFSLLFLLTN